MVKQDTIQMVLLHVTARCRKGQNIVIIPCPLLDLFSSIPEITEENKGTFDIIFPQGLHSFFDKPMTHTQKNKIIFRISFRHMNLIGIMLVLTFGMIATI